MDCDLDWRTLGSLLPRDTLITQGRITPEYVTLFSQITPDSEMRRDMMTPDQPKM